MSTVISDLIWSSSKSRNGGRLVLLALARTADSSGISELSIDKLAALTGLSPRGVSKCVATLVEIGEVSYERGCGHHASRYSILLTGQPSRPEVTGTEFQEVCSGEDTEVHGTSEESPSRTRGGNTPYGSITTTKKQASSARAAAASKSRPNPAVTVPIGAQPLVAALEAAGMVVGWRLTTAEWDQVTALVARWGPERLVEVITPRWSSASPPATARYLLRIWDDLPSASPAVDNVVPLRLDPRGRSAYRNPSTPSAYLNGF
ncbi:hypothetical protein ACFRJ1_06990 [Streptomyces sp. NPDC056773]|uniref:hypothetical protein n=1 Tax=unclassified Streptomyces TaxID=2593676 RepID=UPI0036C9894A